MDTHSWQLASPVGPAEQPEPWLTVRGMVRRGGVVAGLVGVLSGLLAVPASADTPAFAVADGVTQPIHSPDLLNK